MSDRSWKAWERRVARIFGGHRRGADTRGDHAGKTDVVHPHYAIECKLLSRPSFADLSAAARQAEQNGRADQEPIAVVKRVYDRDSDALVILRLETFRDWRL